MEISSGIQIRAPLTRVQGPAGIGPQRQGAPVVCGHPTAGLCDPLQPLHQGLGYISAES